jgi:hypothetical protein
MREQWNQMRSSDSQLQQEQMFSLHQQRFNNDIINQKQIVKDATEISSRHWHIYWMAG